MAARITCHQDSILRVFDDDKRAKADLLYKPKECFVGRMFKKFGREDSDGAMRKHELNRLREQESDYEMENFDDGEEVPLEEHDGSDDSSD